MSNRQKGTVSGTAPPRAGAVDLAAIDAKIAELREATREANAAIKDARATIKEAEAANKTLGDNVREIFAEEQTAMREVIRDWWTGQLEKLSDGIKERLVEDVSHAREFVVDNLETHVEKVLKGLWKEAEEENTIVLDLREDKSDPGVKINVSELRSR